MKIKELIEKLQEFDKELEINMTSRIQHGTNITTINHVGYDRHGNLVITLDDSLIKGKFTMGR